MVFINSLRSWKGNKDKIYPAGFFFTLICNSLASVQFEIAWCGPWPQLQNSNKKRNKDKTHQHHYTGYLTTWEWKTIRMQHKYIQNKEKNIISPPDVFIDTIE